MTKKAKVDLRLAIGAPDGPRSSIWRAYSNKNEVYVSHGGLGGVQKFSFHSSGICRHAYTEQEGPAPGFEDRASLKWRRSPAKTDSLVYVLVARFPTDVLSTALVKEAKAVTWIPPAPSGQTTFLEFVFTRLDENTMQKIAERDRRTLIDRTALPSGEVFVTSWTHDKFDWKPFTIEGVFERPGQHVVSRVDTLFTGRPARFTQFFPPSEKHPAMVVDEYGAYHAPMDAIFNEPMAKVTRKQIHKSSADSPRLALKSRKLS
jgi:hypothetical protein